VMNAAPDTLAGAASGISNAASRLAGLFAVALTGAVAALAFGVVVSSPGAVFGQFPPSGSEDWAAIASAFGVAYRAGMVAATLLALAAAATAWVTLRPDDARPDSGPDSGPDDFLSPEP